MKKIIYSVIFLIFSILFSQTTFAIQCNQIFEGTKVRYDMNHKFYDVWHNNTNKITTIAGRKTRFMDSGNSSELMTSSYLDPGSAFDWTKELKDAKGQISPNKSMRIIETGPTYWRIAKHPNTRTNATKNSHDFMIYYDVNYRKGDSSTINGHVECQYYSVTWCGDGVKDSGYEVCDPNDTSHAGWGNGGCSVSCQPINVDPVATCDNITATPNSGLSTLTSNITCNGTNANTYKINCGNGKTLNGKTGTCTYTAGGGYQPFCTVNGNITSNSCKTTINVTAPTPLIKVEKYSGNTNDLDGNKNHNPNDDSQTIANGSGAVFTIKVSNVGNEKLKDISLSDPKSSSCNKTTTETKNLIKSIGNKDDFLDVNESFTYTCKIIDPKTLTKISENKYENRINVKGSGKKSNIVVTDTDETVVKIINPKILVIKSDGNPNDLDKVYGNDTQTVKTGSGAVFKITVKNNTGGDDLKNVSLVDEKSPNCSKTNTEVRDYLKSIGNKDDILNDGEEFSYNCKVSDPTSLIFDSNNNRYINNIIVNGTGILTGKKVSDDDSSYVKLLENNPVCTGLTADNLEDYIDFNSNFSCNAEGATSYKIEVKDINNNVKYTSNTSTGSYTFTKEGNYIATCYINGKTKTENTCNKTILAKKKIYDLSLDKSVVTSGPYSIGQDVTFRITVKNEGNVPASNIKVRDTIPEGLTLNDNRWTVENNNRATRVIPGTIQPGNSAFVDIIFTINDTAKGNIKNIAEIISDNGDDDDSNPDNNIEDEDDQDDEVITINTLTCNAGVSGVQSSPISETTPNLCANTGETVVHFIPTIGGKTTSYNWDCTDGTKIYTGGNCNASYTSGGGGGGDTAQCYDTLVSGNEVTCLGNNKSKSFGVICDTVTDGNNLSDTVGEFKVSEGKDVRGNNYAQFECMTVNQPKCFVYNEERTTYGSKAWRSSNQCTVNETKTCGDGRVDKPNDSGVNEQCDGGINCNSDCTLKKTNGTPNCGNSIKYFNEHPSECSTTTRPSGGEIWIYPIGDTLVGGNSVFDFDSTLDRNKVTNNGGDEGYLKIVNIGDEPYNLSGDKFCVYDKYDLKDGNDKLLKFNGSTSYKQLCEEHNIGWLYPGQTHYFRKDASVITGNPDGISAGKDNETTTLVGSFLGYETAYFAAKMNVTVAKPSISGQGGGTSYLTGSTDISNVNSIAKTVSYNNASGRAVNTNQNNFVSTVLGNTDDLSNVDTIKNTELKDEAKDESTKLENDAEEVVEESTFVGTNDEITNLNSFGSYRGIENVLYVKDTNVTLSAQNLSETKTYIIENGNLTIEGNIESTKNIAFIVKNGDIIIKNNVTRIDGTYVNISGKVKSEKTPNKLTINGSIYGDLSELTSNRTHMSMDDNGNISVGTIVNYGSNILKKPAPLIGQFIKEYTTSIKIAQ